MNSVVFVVGHLKRLRKQHNQLRKRGGNTHQEFLDAPFEFPEVNDPKPTPPVPTTLNRAGDPQTLRLVNISLATELTETEEKLTVIEENLDKERQHVEDLRRERDAAKRKSTQCDDLRKKQKAETEKVRYWQNRVSENHAEASASTQLRQLEKENEQLKQQLEETESRVIELQQALEDERNEKVILGFDPFARVCVCVCVCACVCACVCV